MTVDVVPVKPAQGLVIASWVVLALALIVPLFGFISFIMGIILLAKERYFQGTAILVLSPVVGIVALLFWWGQL